MEDTETMEDMEIMEDMETMVEDTAITVEDMGIVVVTETPVEVTETMEDMEATTEDMETVVETNTVEDMETMVAETVEGMEILGMVGVMVLVTEVEDMDRAMVPGVVTRDMVAEMAILPTVVATMVDMGVALAVGMVVAAETVVVEVTGEDMVVEAILEADTVEGVKTVGGTNKKKKKLDMHM